MTPWWLYLVGIVPLVLVAVWTFVLWLRHRRPGEPAVLESASRAASERQRA